MRYTGWFPFVSYSFIIKPKQMYDPKEGEAAEESKSQEAASETASEEKSEDQATSNNGELKD